MRTRSGLYIETSDSDNNSTDSDSDSESTSISTSVNMAFIKKGLSKWGTEGLDIADSGFSKLHSKEQHFETAKTKYDLSNDTFLTYTDNLIEKVNRMYSKDVFTAPITETVTAPDGTISPIKCFVLTEYTKVTEDEMVAARNLRWPTTENFADQSAADKACDIQIKASTIGSYIHDSLTEAAKKQLKADENLFQVKDTSGNPFYDGPMYFWKIAELVDPNNDTLVEDIRTKLRSLNVKDFGYSIIQTLAEFKNMRTRVIDLGGTYSNDEQFLDFWAALRSMKEKEFARYVNTERDNYRDTQKSSRMTIEKYMTKFQKKETAMKNDNIWNVASPEDAMIMALLTTLEKKGDSSNKSTGGSRQREKTQDADWSTLTDEEKQKRRESKIPAWKKVTPKDGEATTKEKDGRTYHWCKLCRQGKGMWAMHTEHKDDFKKERKQQQDASDASNEKKVSFAAETETKDKETEENDKDDGKPKAKVKKALLDNARAYLAQFEGQDFQMGGV